MNFFQRFGKKTVEAVKQAAKETTKEDAEETLDILEKVLKVGVPIALVVGAVKNQRPVEAAYIPQQAYTQDIPATVINLFVDPGKGGMNA